MQHKGFDDRNVRVVPVRALSDRAQAELQVKLENLRDSLSRDRDAVTAQRDYQYTARTRLYQELQPLLFQLAERSEAAYERIVMLARLAREGELGPVKPSRLHDQTGYVGLTMAYRSVAPVVLLRLVGRRLTVVDLTVDDDIRTQYMIAKLLYPSFSAGIEMASVGVPVPYDEREGLQHVPTAHLDLLVEEMTSHDATGSYCIDYGRFTERIGESDSRLQQVVTKAMSPFQGFHPRQKPVLWRMLIAQAHVHRALMSRLDSPTGPPILPHTAIPVEERALFDWREGGSDVTDEEALSDTFDAVERFLFERLSSRRFGHSA